MAKKLFAFYIEEALLLELKKYAKKNQRSAAAQINHELVKVLVFDGEKP